MWIFVLAIVSAKKYFSAKMINDMESGFFDWNAKLKIRFEKLMI